MLLFTYQRHQIQRLDILVRYGQCHYIGNNDLLVLYNLELNGRNDYIGNIDLRNIFW